MSTSVTEAHPTIQVAPAPWVLKGRSWTFILSGLPKTSSFPAGWSSEWQAEAEAAGGEFIGGQGTVQVISYSESPVGPYDELVYAPGKWKYADGTKGFRVTRIYVSSKDSTWNGRKNWNIPKQVASFNYHRDASSNVWSLSVSHPSSPDSPFFKVTVRPITVLSSIGFPYNTKLLGSFLTLVQPPLPKGPLEEEAETDKWCTLIPAMIGRGRLVSVHADLDPSEEGGSMRLADGIRFPNVELWKLALALEDLTIDFGVPTWKDSFDA